MKNHLILLVFSLLLISSCGKDNDDIVLPEDVSNINFDIGITFGVVRLNCTSDCIRGYKFSNGGAFPADTASKTINDVGTLDFLPTSLPACAQFISDIDRVRNVPRGIRDVPSTNLDETISKSNFDTVYFLEYTLNSGGKKTIQFFNGGNTDRQVSTYYNSIIDIVSSLDVFTIPFTDCGTL